MPKDDNNRPIEVVGKSERGLKPINQKNLNGNEVAPVNPETGNVVLPKDKDGYYVPPTNLAGDEILLVDQNNNPIFGVDENGDLVIPNDKDGEPLL